MSDKLTDKQELFCHEYLVDLNATQAAVRAGYSEKTAQEQASRLLSNVMVQCRIAQLKAERNERVQINADYVLRQAVKLHERCMQEVSPKVNRKGEQITDEFGNPLFVFDSSGASKALEIIGKHTNVQAFIDRSKTEIITDHISDSQLSGLNTETLREIRDIIKKKKEDVE